jgi:hypothetical protein
MGAPTHPSADQAAVSEIETDEEAPLRLRIHDSSRFEWSVSLPLPSDRKLDYRIEASLEIPSSAVASYAPWDQLRTVTRLDGPAGVANPQDLDALRRGAVTLTQMLARARDGFNRHCRAASSEPEAAAALGGEKSFLLVWLEAALRAVREAREKLTHGAPDEPPSILRERLLVDEYASVRLLDMLGDAQRALEQTREGPAREALQNRLTEALRSEIDYRASKDFLQPAAGAPDQLEAWLARAARLKKHFEEVLFLDRETSQLDERVQQWLGTFGALLGGVLAFAALQIAVLLRPPGRVELSWGLGVVALLAGIGYAARNRMREWGSSWLAGKVDRFHAQRITRCRVPARRLPSRDLLIEAREWCLQSTSSGPDPLHPEAGASLPETRVRYIHRGKVLPHRELSKAGVRRVRHIFRYDLSPLFSRLEDDLKSVPVTEAGGLRFVEVPRSYRVPVQVAVEREGRRDEERVEIVLNKSGLQRIRVMGQRERSAR